jgi:hypothetical protein
VDVNLDAELGGTAMLYGDALLHLAIASAPVHA